MTGIIAEKTVKDGYEFWIVKDANTKQIISVGHELSQAIDAYETILANEKMTAELGLSLDDFEF